MSRRPPDGIRHPFMESCLVTRTLLLALLITSTSAGAIVIRHDVDDAKYRIAASEFPALADMPGEGHGVLIAPRWMWLSGPHGPCGNTSPLR